MLGLSKLKMRHAGFCSLMGWISLFPPLNKLHPIINRHTFKSKLFIQKSIYIHRNYLTRSSLKNQSFYFWIRRGKNLQITILGFCFICIVSSEAALTIDMNKFESELLAVLSADSFRLNSPALPFALCWFLLIIAICLNGTDCTAHQLRILFFFFCF